MKILTLSEYLKQQYGQKVYKIALSSGCTCPNRDGTIDTGGCTFCSQGGAGEFAQAVMTGKYTQMVTADQYAQAVSVGNSVGKLPVQGNARAAVDTINGVAGETPSAAVSLDYVPTGVPDEVQVRRAIEAAKGRVLKKLPANVPLQQRKFIAYFQSFTNTYGDTGRLDHLYREVLEQPDIVALSIGTRPDCLEDEKLKMLSELNKVKPVWVELGLQTIHDDTARQVHRGYPTSVFDDCYHRLKEAGLTVIVHVILGLPGESRNDMLETVRYLGGLQPLLDGIKLQMLNILEGSRMAQEYREHPYAQMSMEEYTDLVVDCLKLLPENTVIHRMTGDGPRKLLISPAWVTDKKRVMNMLRRKIDQAKR